MNGTIEFESMADLAEFLKEFTGSTACFFVVGLKLKFTGGY